MAVSPEVDGVGAGTAHAVLPAPTLPKGGGAVHGLGEKFSVEQLTGGCSLTVPLPISPGRGESTPQLALSYRGSGPSVFGNGWQLSVPVITRKCSRGVPTHTDRDTFQLSGTDLVPVLVPDGAGGSMPYDQPEVIDGVLHRVLRFRPRTETDFTRIEQCRNPVTLESFWRTVSRTNVTMLFGTSAATRVFDPTATWRVAEWLLEEVSDDRGNVAGYFYKPEDTAQVPPSIFEQRRTTAGASAPAGRYLKTIRYANTVPGDVSSCRLSVVLDYGEHDLSPAEVRPWPARQDPYSSCRYGFDVRTWRLCRRVLMFHEFPEELAGPSPRLVRTVELLTQPDPISTMLGQLRQTGYDWADGRYATLALPTLDLTYSQPVPEATVRTGRLAAVPDGAHLHWVDLDGDGLPGVLVTTPGGWWYQQPDGNGRWDPPRAVSQLPGVIGGAATPGLVDVDGSGRLSAAASLPGLGGSSVRGIDGSWSAWQPYDGLAVLEIGDIGQRNQDLDGDGLPDAVLAGPDMVRWAPSKGRAGYGARIRVATATTEAQGARPPSADLAHEWFTVDLTGDGLSDLVRVRNGSVDYWPNMGYGRFGAQVTMGGAPVFDTSDLFDPARLRLGDLDGSGTCDLIYLGRRDVTVWVNRCGNTWAPGRVVMPLPTVRNTDDLQLLDLLGKGTPCLVWTTSDPAGDGVVVRYLDLAAEGRPRQLTGYTNNLGARTTIQWTPTTTFSLADRAGGNPWATRLRSPMQVVGRVDVSDGVSATSHSSLYRYRDGDVDPAEREFRGFGRVEMMDAETFSATPPGQPAVHQTPTRTLTWYHLGGPQPAPADGFAADPLARPLGDHDVVGVDGGTEWRQAIRAFAGHPVRIEVYGDDGVSAAPYSVTTHRLRAIRVQPSDGEQPAVFRVETVESLEAWYERTTDDPRQVHSVNLATDVFGNVLSTAKIAYPRRLPEIPEQDTVLFSWTTNDVTNTDTTTALRLGVVTATTSYQVTGLPVPPAGRYEPATLATTLPALPVISFEQVPSPAIAQRRLSQQTRHEYWADDLSGPLAPGLVGSRGLLRRTTRLAFTAGLVAQVYGPDVDATVLSGEAGYQQVAGDWWMSDGVVHYDPAVFYQPSAWESPFGNNTASVTYDGYGLQVVETTASTTAPLDLNAVALTHDYRMLCPVSTLDPNGTVSAVSMDPLGRVVAGWFTAADGTGDTPDLPGNVHSYGSSDWQNGIGPAWSHTESREVFGQADSGWQRQRLFTDGLGRIVMTKSQAEPGMAMTTDGGGTVLVDTTPAPRWIGTGRTVFNNKGMPVEQYEPYFSTTVGYENADALVKQGLTEVRSYDPLGRVLRVDHPDGSFDTHQLTPWQEVNADRNDTVLASQWYATRQGGGTPAAAARAASLAAAHANTPTVSLTDPLGRVVRTRADNGAGDIFETVLHLGLEGETTAVDDALDRRAVSQVYDAAGRVLATQSIDAGGQRVLPAADGIAVRQWSGHGYAAWSRYDGLRRPTHLFVRAPGSSSFRLAEYTLYGELHPQARTRFLVGKVHRRYDRAGLSQADRHDLAGHLVEGIRRLVTNPSEPDWTLLDGQPLVALDWLTTTLLDSEVFAARTSYDAVGRPVTQLEPDGTTLHLEYGTGGLMSSVSAAIGGQPATELVTSIDYDARRRRTRIAYAAGVVTTYDYDEPSSRLNALTSMRGGTTLQGLAYTYDPMGNVTQIDDAAQQTLFFDGAVVTPRRQFTYDPTYRLTRATGREHSSLGIQPDNLGPTIEALPHPNDVNAMRTYTQNYAYDAVGNFVTMAHSGGPGWTRHYQYAAGTNRLSAHSIPGDSPSGPYSGVIGYDTAGHMTSMPTVAGLSWDHTGMMSGADLGGGGKVSYHHDGTGARVRKIWQRLGAMREERIYLGTYEVFRRFVSNVLVFERTTVHVMDGKRAVALIETVTVDTQHPGADRTPVIRYQLADHLGSCALECDATGQLLSYEEFHPYGTTAVWLAGTAVTVSLKRYRYSGKENDEETGLYHYGVRDYVSWLGRWTSPDPAGLIDGANRFSYVSCNPIRLIDPTGMGGDVPEQLWFSELKAFWAQARTTAGGRGFSDQLYQYFRDVKQLWGGPASYDLGHVEKPFAFLEPGEVTQIGIQESGFNRSQAAVEKAMVAAARKAGVPVRDTEGFWPGAVKGQRWGRQPAVPPVQSITPSYAGVADPAFEAARDTALRSGTKGRQLTLDLGKTAEELPRGVPHEQLELPFNATPAGPQPQQLTLDLPEGAAGTTDATAASKAAPVADDAAVAADATKVAPVADDATVVADVTAASDSAKVAPVANDADALAKVAPIVDDAQAAGKAVPAATDAANTSTAVTSATATGDAAKVAPLVQDAAAATQTEAELLRAAKTGGDVLKEAAPVVKEVAPLVKEAGSMTKLVNTGSKVLKAAQPVIKVVAPVARVVGEVAKPLGVGLAAVDLVTAKNNTDRLVASGDLVAGVAMYGGPVGEAFGVGYTAGGLIDKGIEKASMATVGVDLSPSNGIAHQIDAVDKSLSYVLPDDKSQPAYKNENKVAWFLIDKLGF